MKLQEITEKITIVILTIQKISFDRNFHPRYKTLDGKVRGFAPNPIKIKLFISYTQSNTDYFKNII